MPSELYYPSGAASLVPNIYKFGSLATSTLTTIWTPTSGKSIVLYGFMVNILTGGTAMSFELTMNSTTFVHFSLAVAAMQQHTFEDGLRIWGVNDLLRIDASGATAFNYTVYGCEI